MRRAQFRILALPPSLNRWTRGSPFKAAAAKLESAQWAMAAVAEAKASRAWDGQPFAKARIVAYMHRKIGRPGDLDNRVPKAFVDQLVKSGVLLDDNDEVVVEVSLRRGIPCKQPWTELWVEEVAENE